MTEVRVDGKSFYKFVSLLEGGILETPKDKAFRLLLSRIGGSRYADFLWSTLSEVQQEVVYRRFGLSCEFKDIAKHFGRNTSQIYRAYREAGQKLETIYGSICAIERILAIRKFEDLSSGLDGSEVIVVQGIMGIGQEGEEPLKLDEIGKMLGIGDKSSEQIRVSVSRNFTRAMKKLRGRRELRVFFRNRTV